MKVDELIHTWIDEKRFCAIGTLRSIRISRLAKIPTLNRDLLRVRNDNYLSCTEGFESHSL